MKRLTLREARELKGWTQVQLAERAGLQQSHISAIELGRNKQPEIETMGKLGHALGMVALLSVQGLVFEERER